NERQHGLISASASMMLHHQQQPQHSQFSMTHTPTQQQQAQQQQPPSTGEKRQTGGPRTLRSDLKLMFANAKHFNEEKSQVHQDAIYLEKLLKKKIKNLGPRTDVSITSSTSAAQQAAVSSSSSLPAVCRTCSTPSETTVTQSRRHSLLGVRRLPTPARAAAVLRVHQEADRSNQHPVQAGLGKYTQAPICWQTLSSCSTMPACSTRRGSQDLSGCAGVAAGCHGEASAAARLDEDPVAAEVPDVMAAVRDVMKGLLTQTMNHAREAIADGSSDRPVIPLEEIFHRVQAAIADSRRFQEDLFDAFARSEPPPRRVSRRFIKTPANCSAFFVRTARLDCYLGGRSHDPSVQSAQSSNRSSCWLAWRDHSRRLIPPNAKGGVAEAALACSASTMVSEASKQTAHRQGIGNSCLNPYYNIHLYTNQRCSKRTSVQQCQVPIAFWQVTWFMSQSRRFSKFYLSPLAALTPRMCTHVRVSNTVPGQQQASFQKIK
uniref:Bromo domain-containing protein n=1 Tax=Macrostomum lignano TaxID=282301 RepID=A0A1I8FJL4_9PLAT